jgi:hypothetical protein
VWDTATGKLIMTLPGHGDMNGATALRFSADGRKLTSFGTDFYARVSDLSTGKAIQEFPVRIAGLNFPERGDPHTLDEFASLAANSAVFSADGCRLCLAGRDKQHVFDTATGKETLSLEFQPNWGEIAAFSPDAAQLLVVGCGKTIETRINEGETNYERAKEKPLVCWDAKTGRKNWEVILPTGYLHCLAYAPDGRTVAVHSRDFDRVNPVEFRDAATGRLLGRLDKLLTGATHVDFTPDGKRIVLVMGDGAVLLYNVPDFKK